MINIIVFESIFRRETSLFECINSILKHKDFPLYTTCDLIGYEYRDGMAIDDFLKKTHYVFITTYKAFR